MSHVCARPRAGRGPAGDSRGGRRRRRGRGPGPALARGRFGARTRGFHTHRCGSRSETLVSRGSVRRFLRRHRASRELGPRPACVDFPRAGSSVQNAVASRLTSVARTRTRRNESLAAFTTASPPLPLLRPQPPSHCQSQHQRALSRESVPPGDPHPAPVPRWPSLMESRGLCVRDRGWICHPFLQVRDYSAGVGRCCTALRFLDT